MRAVLQCEKSCRVIVRLSRNDAHHSVGYSLP